MISKILFNAALTAIIFQGARSQVPLGYQLPPNEIVKIVDAPVTPMISVSPDKRTIGIIERPPIITIKELSAEELRLGGLRINPVTNGPSRQTFNNSFRLMNIDGTNIRQVTGLPVNPALGSPEWSRDGKKFAFTNTTENGIELWVCDVPAIRARKIADNINMVFRNQISWLPDNSSLVYLVTDPDRGNKPERSSVPEGPVGQENLGIKGQARTYQDLLKDPVDERSFEYFAKSQLMLWNGSLTTKLGKQAIITDATPSPDGNFLLIHGMADNNSGTFPIQSERYYAALKGFGATTKLVMLPNESHGYAARETILHKHWEVLDWMNKYVKNRKNISD